MSDSNKKVNNPLFSSAVTGGTVEDFSQNALLLPAKEKPPPPPPVLNVTQGTQGMSESDLLYLYLISTFPELARF